ncbi:TFIID-domain-containing protein [Dacryopinax primogenitus]|uniref:TFIID-domain-containing protein n=1 Tax=Dacryopinax primogenitus (strain DJM 731) TaxID=1858805 RepID=M5GCK9_DACPD|nr:TFIID-domain-containing protein [Dacryopinax primogenitus]EJU06275.1 TFIID-domain-containing protein [Dacryopinax primogenitus]
MPGTVLPRDARLIALILSANPAISDAQPQVLHQLLEFSHRYSSQVMNDSLVYAEHAGRVGNITMEDLTLAIQARAGWEFAGRIPKEYLQSLADKTNSVPLPSIPETYGVRLPPAKHCLTQVDFDLVPNRPPPGSDYYYDEEAAKYEQDAEGEWGLVDAEGEADAAGEDDAMGEDEPGLGDADEGGDLFGEDDEGDDMDDDEDTSHDPLAGLQSMSNGFGQPGSGDYQPARRLVVEDEDYDA